MTALRDSLNEWTIFLGLIIMTIPISHDKIRRKKVCNVKVCSICCAD